MGKCGELMETYQPVTSIYGNLKGAGVPGQNPDLLVFPKLPLSKLKVPLDPPRLGCILQVQQDISMRFLAVA